MKVAKFLGITIRHAFADSNSVTVVVQFAEQGSRMIFKTITGFDLLKKKQRLSAATYLVIHKMTFEIHFHFKREVKYFKN